MTNETFDSLESLCRVLNHAHRRVVFEDTLTARHREQIASAFDYLLFKRSKTDELSASLFDMIAKRIVYSEAESYSDVLYEVVEVVTVTRSEASAA